MCLQSDGGSCPQSVGRSAKVCLLDAIKPISLLLDQYRCWIAENIIATVTDFLIVTDSSQLKKNNESSKTRIGEPRPGPPQPERYRRRRRKAALSITTSCAESNF